MIRSSLLYTVLFSSIVLSGCNLYGGLSSPSGDQQILSAARAALDQGDYADAIKFYGQLSSSAADTALAETAYADLDQQNAGMQSYAGAFGKGTTNVGPAITTFAESLIPAGQTRRVAIWTAFNEQVNIKDPKLKALVRFLGSLSFAAEILAETSSNGTKIMKADLNDGKVMVSTTVFPSSSSAPSTSPTKVAFSLGGDNATSSGAASLADVNVSTATYNMFNSALIEIIQDVDVLGDQGTFGTNTLSFASTVTAAFTAPGSQLLVPVLTTAYAGLLTGTQVNIGE
jgi:hypothetical protein